jgi:hypothetical protein
LHKNPGRKQTTCRCRDFRAPKAGESRQYFVRDGLVARIMSSRTSLGFWLRVSINQAEGLPLMPRLVYAAATSVRIKGILIIFHKIEVLLVLAENTISNREEFDPGTHKTGKRVLRRADNRFAAHIETGVHKNRAAG